MRKRARLARRILREHRQGYEGHYTKVAQGQNIRLMEWWACPHCVHYRPGGTPHIYREAS